MVKRIIDCLAIIMIVVISGVSILFMIDMTKQTERVVYDNGTVEEMTEEKATETANDAFTKYYASDILVNTSDIFDTISDYAGYSVYVTNGGDGKDYRFVVQYDGTLKFDSKGTYTNNDNIISQYVYLLTGGAVGRLDNYGYSNVYIDGPIMVGTWVNYDLSAEKALQDATNAFKAYYASDAIASVSDAYDTMADYAGFTLYVINGTYLDYKVVVQNDGSLEIDTTKGTFTPGEQLGLLSLASATNLQQSGRADVYGYSNVYILSKYYYYPYSWVENVID